MKILVINAGSSTLKFQVIILPERLEVCKGMVERIGSKHAKLYFQKSEVDLQLNLEEMPDHHAALGAILKYLMDEEIGTIKSSDEIDLVAHRVVHGGHVFNEPIAAGD